MFQNAYLLMVFAASIGALLFSIIRLKVNPFLALLGAGLLAGLLSGMPPEAIPKQLSAGFGQTLSGVGIVIGLGVVFGRILAEAKVTAQIAALLLGITGRKFSPLAVNLTGYLSSIPVFSDAAFVIFIPLLKDLSGRTRLPLLTFVTAMAVGLVTTHCLVIPTPGPLAVMGNLGLEAGPFLLTGMVVALPASLTGGWLGGLWLGRKAAAPAAYRTGTGADTLTAEPPARPVAVVSASGASAGGAAGSGPAVGQGPAVEKEVEELYSAPGISASRAAQPRVRGVIEPSAAVPSGALSLGILLLPIGLILAGSLSARLLPADAAVRQWLLFTGDKNVALLSGVVLAFVLLRPYLTGSFDKIVSESAAAAGPILLITGGAFGSLMGASGISVMLVETLPALNLSVLLPGFLLSAILRAAQGPATVALVTASSVLAPAIASAGAHPLTAGLAICCGSMCCPLPNDPGFWVVSRFGELTVPETLRAWTLTSTAGGIAGLLVTFLPDAFFFS